MATNDTRGAEGDVVERMRQLVEAMAPQTFAEVRVTVGDLDALVRLAECGLDAGAAPAPSPRASEAVTELADALLDAVVAATALRHWVPLERLDTPEGKDAMARLRRAANVSGAHNWGNPHPDRDAAERRGTGGDHEGLRFGGMGVGEKLAEGSVGVRATREKRMGPRRGVRHRRC